MVDTLPLRFQVCGLPVFFPAHSGIHMVCRVDGHCPAAPFFLSLSFFLSHVPHPFIWFLNCSDHLEVYAWGDGQYGQLGLGDSGASHRSPVAVGPINALGPVRMVACGENFTLLALSTFSIVVHLLLIFMKYVS